MPVGPPPRQGGVVPLDHEPIQWTGRGIEPRSPRCKRGIFPLDEPPMFCKRSVWELNPVFRLTTAACSHSTYRPMCLRIAVIPDGIEPSLPCMSRRCLRRWTTGSIVTEVGVEPTQSQVLGLLALPV